MRKRIVAVIAALPLAVAAQEGATPPSPPPEAAQAAPAARPQDAPPPPGDQPAQPQPAQAPPRAPPPPQYAPPQAPPAPPGSPPAGPPYGRPPRARDTWYIGFGLGTGDGTLKLDSGTARFDELVFSGRTSVSLNFRVGATLSPRLLLGLDTGAVASVAQQAGHDSSVQLSYYDVGVMFFPSERGLFLRGAVGLAALEQKLDDTTLFRARGSNVLVGVGYAFWLGNTFNLTLNLDGQAYVFNRANVDTATAWSAWLGFDWY